MTVIQPGHKPAVDPATPVGPGWDDTALFPDQPPAAVTPGRRPFAVKNGAALAVFQRSAHDFRTAVVAVTTADPTNQIVGRLPGRESVTLWVPASVVLAGTLITVAAGVLFSPVQGDLQGGGGSFLGVGDSVTIESESAVYVGLVPGSATGYCQYLDLFNGGDNPGS